MENDKGIVPGKLSENYIFSQTFDRAGRGWKVRGERLEKLLDCQTISLVTKNSHLCEKSEYNKMLYNEHSVDKFTVCSHSRALRREYNTKNTLLSAPLFASIPCPAAFPKCHNIRISNSNAERISARKYQNPNI